MPHNYATHLSEVLTAISATSSTVPAQRALHRAGFSFSALHFQQQLPIWHHIWQHSGSYYGRLHAYFFLEQYITKKEHLKTIWETSALWQTDVSKWSHCDALAKLNTKALEAFPEEVYHQLKLWNTHPSLWCRRQSVVSLLYFHRTKKAYLPFSQIASLVTPLLSDPEYYVQKGVGWTLREMHSIYPQPTYEYLHTHIRQISAIAFTIAIEKMEEPEKIKLKSLRR